MSQKLLTKNDINTIIKRAQEGSKEDMELLIKQNENLIWSVVSKFVNKGIPKEDLFQVAAIGFIESVHRFDSSLKTKLTTYAVPYMSGLIRRYMRDVGRTDAIRSPRTISELAAKILKAELEDSTPEEISRALGEDRIKAIKESLVYIKEGRGITISFNKVVYQGTDGGSGITLEDTTEGDANGHFWIERIALREAVKKLSENEQKLIHLRYYKDMTQAEISRKFGLRPMQVSRMERRVLKKLRKLYGGER